MRQHKADETELGVLEARSVAAFKTKVFKQFMTFEDARLLLTLAASSPETVHEWLDNLDDCEDRASQYPKINPGDGKARKIQFWRFTNLRRRFVHDILVDFNARVNSISDIGRMAVFTDNEFLYLRFSDFNPQSLIYGFLIQKEGILATISGNMGLGKTDFALFLAELLLKAEDVKFHVVTNIWLEQTTLEKYQTLHYRYDMRSLLLRLCDCIEDDNGNKLDGHAVLAMDETALFFSRREPGKKENIQFEKFIRLIRHYNASMILIDQMRDGLPGAALELRSVIYHKTGLKMVHYSSYVGEKEYNHYLAGLPRTTLGFDTKHMGYFDYNVDLEALYEYIKGRDDPIRATREFLNAPMAARPTSNREKIKSFIEQHPGCIQKDIFTALSMDQSYCGHLCRELVDNGEIDSSVEGNKSHYFPL